jgi:hypothetical protein
VRNTQKSDKTKKAEKKLTSNFLSIFSEFVFDVVFLNSPYREALKGVLKKKKSRKNMWHMWGWLVSRNLITYTPSASWL